MSERLDVMPGLLSWSADGTRLLAYARAADGGAWERGRFVVVGADGRVADAAPEAPPACVARDPSSRLPVVHGGWAGRAVLLKLGCSASGTEGWWRATDGQARPLAAGVPASARLRPTAAGPRLIDEGRTWAVSSEGTTSRLLDGALRLEAQLPTVGFRGEQNPPSAPEAGVGSSSPLSSDAGRSPLACGGRGCLDWRGASTGDGALILRRATRESTLLHLNARLKPVAFAMPQPLRRQSVTGSEVVDWLYCPAPTGVRPPPLIVLPYPGAIYEAPPFQGRPAAFALTSNPQVLVGLGYAVLVPSLPRPAAPRGTADGIAAELRSALAFAIASGEVDPDRIALWGQSFGGYGVLVAAEAGLPVRAVVAQAAPADLLAMYGALDPVTRAFPEDARALTFTAGWSETGQAALDGPPWIRPDDYLTASPLRFADRLNVPLLLVHGDQDFIALTQAEAMFTALRRQDRNVALVTAWGEGHVIESPGNVRALYKSVDDFLRRTLSATDASSRPPPTPRSQGGP